MLIVPVNNSVIVNSPVVFAYGLNHSVIPFQTGYVFPALYQHEHRFSEFAYSYSENVSFSLTFPNGTVLSESAGVLSVCRTWPGGTSTVFQTADSAGIYVSSYIPEMRTSQIEIFCAQTVTANATYTLPVSGANCSTGPYSYQSEVGSNSGARLELILILTDRLCCVQRPASTRFRG